MKKSIFILTLVLFRKCLFCEAQITFQKTYGGQLGDYGSKVEQTSDSGYVISGFTNSFGLGNFDMYLIRTNENGDTLWTKTFGKAIDDRIRSVTQTSDGGFAISGFINYDTYLMKTSANGNIQWSANFGFSSGSGGNSVQQTSDGGFIFTGFFSNPGANNDIYLIKTDSLGYTNWIKSYGGTFSDIGVCVHQTNDHGYIVAGSYTLLNNYDMLLIKTDSLGDTLWTRTYGGTNHDIGFSVLSTIDGGYIFLGSSNTFTLSGVYLIKTDSLGIPMWSKSYSGKFQSNPGTQVNSIEKTKDGGYIISAEWGNQQLYLLKIDSLGNVQWAKTFGGSNSEFAGSCQQTFDGGYIIAGTTNSFGAGGYDVYLIKTDSVGISGCNESNLTVIPTTPPTQILNHTITLSIPTIVNSPPDYSAVSGSIVNNLCSTVGINQSATDYSFFISPNPTTGNSTLRFGNIIVEGSIEIYNAIGEKIDAQLIFNESKKEINLNKLPDGIYFVKVFDGEYYYSRKLIVEHS